MLSLKKYFGLIIVLLISYWTVKPLFISGFFTMHDDTQVARVFEMGKALYDGMFPVRWVQDLGYGYGYPLFNFYAPLAYYVGGFFTFFVDALIATKIMIAIGTIISGVFMYILVRSILGDIAGIIAGLFYVYAPYHAVNLYVRGDIAEAYAYAFIPIVFYGLWKVIAEKRWLYVVVGALGYAGIVLSHNLTAMMVTPFIASIVILYSIISYLKKESVTIYYLISIILFGLLLSAFYWIPALLEMKYTNVFSQVGGGADFRDHFVCINQFWNSLWGFGGSAKGCLDGLSFRIGKLNIVLTVIALVLAGVFIFKKKRNNIRAVFLIFSAISLIVSIFLMLENSRMIWEFIKPMAFLQYPWRFLSLVSFFSSILIGYLVWFMQGFTKKIKYYDLINYLSISGLIIALLYFNVKLFQPQTIISKNVKDYTDNIDLKWRVSKISDEYLPKDFIKPTDSINIVNNKLDVIAKSVRITPVIDKTGKVISIIESSANTEIYVKMAYFPSWRFYLDKKEINPSVSSSGYSFNVPSGKHIIDITFQETTVEKVSNLISLFGLGLLAIRVLLKNKIRKFNEKS